MAKPDVYLRIDDLPLFKKARSKFRGETMSQYERAQQIRKAFAECMTNTLGGIYCSMPASCATGDPKLICYHLDVDYSNFSGHGIPLTGHARTMIDSRLRAIGTLVYRYQMGQSGSIGALPGDIHLPALNKVRTFTGGKHKAPAQAPVAGPAAPLPPAKSGFFGRLFGL